MYKFLSTSKGVDLSIGFYKDRARRVELLNNKTVRGKFNVEISSKDVFGYAEHQEHGTYGSGYKLFMKRNTDHCVLHREGGDNGRSYDTRF